MEEAVVDRLAHGRGDAKTQVEVPASAAFMSHGRLLETYMLFIGFKYLPS